MAPQSLTVCENDVEQDWRKLTISSKLGFFIFLDNAKSGIA